MPVHLIRSISQSVSEYYYSVKTDVWFFADRTGFAHVLKQLRGRLSSRVPAPLIGIPNNSPGMRAVVLLAPTDRSAQPALMAFERPVLWRGRSAMQLILIGNRAGYARLCGVLEQAMNAKLGPRDHWHCADVHDKWMIPPSVALNVRGAVNRWTKADLAEYGDDLRSGGNHQFPEGIGFCLADKAFRHDHFPKDIGAFLWNQARKSFH